MSRIAVIVAALLVVLTAWAVVPVRPAAFAGGANALTFEDRAGNGLGTILARDTEHAVRVPLDRVAPAFRSAIVAAEDAHFAAHDGVDLSAVARAALEFARSGHAVSGASTITMQLARLRYGYPRSFAGKVLEALQARRIELGCSKAQILAAYIDRLPMGGNLTGVEAGARAYFGVPASDLDLAQAAMLAAIPNDPVRLDPYAARAALERRRRAIIDRLVALGIVTPAAAQAARDESLHLLPPNAGIVAAPQLLFRLAGSAAPQATRLRTTIDLDLQRFVEAETRHVVAALGDRNVRDAAAIVIDNRDGAILAYAGSAGYFDGGAGSMNDGVTALRQPGSTLKPLLYELAFERRTLRPNAILADVPVSYALPGGRAYRPGDYSDAFAGPVRARVALANSLNVPAVGVLADLGVAPFLARLRALGFSHLQHDATYYGLGLALGDGEVTLEELAGAYAAMANGGRPVRVHALDGAPVAADAPVGETASWALVTDMLSDAAARARSFGVSSLLRTPFPSAVKTGTSSDFRDTWTVGFTRDVTVATWAGNFDGAPMRRVSGVTGAAPLWNRIIRHIAARATPARFAAPAGYARHPICADTGVRPTASCTAVVAEWLDARDLPGWAAPARPLPRRYDAWLAMQPPRVGDPLRIVAPQDGATFVAAPGAAVEVIARGATRISWTLNGMPLRTRAARWTLPLERGNYVVRARSAQSTDTIRFTVGDGLRHPARRGFTVISAH